MALADRKFFKKNVYDQFTWEAINAYWTFLDVIMPAVVLGIRYSVFKRYSGKGGKY